jgi:uncharacterized membrane protein required for colicin V production
MAIFLVFILQLTPLTEEPVWAKSQLVASSHPAVKWLSDLVMPTLQRLKSQAEKEMQDATKKSAGVTSPSEPATNP